MERLLDSTLPGSAGHAELEALRNRSKELAARLDSPQALRINARLHLEDPGDALAANRFGIGLLQAGRTREAVAVLERAQALQPGSPIARRRLEEARRALRRGPLSRGSRGSEAWTDFEPGELVEHALRGPGRDASLLFCAASLRASEAFDASWTAVVPIREGRRFRIVGGIVSAVSTVRDALTVAVPTSAVGVIAAAEAAGGEVRSTAKALPSLELAIPRVAVEGLFDALLAVHVEHLRLSLATGAPTHLNKHHPALRRAIVSAADAV